MKQQHLEKIKSANKTFYKKKKKKTQIVFYISRSTFL